MSKTGSEPGVKPGVEKIEQWARTEHNSSPTPLTSSRPERLLSPERVLWTEVTANGSLSPAQSRLQALTLPQGRPSLAAASRDTVCFSIKDQPVIPLRGGPESPTQPGVYWFQSETTSRALMVDVHLKDGKLTEWWCNQDVPVTNLKGIWRGPIPPSTGPGR